MITRLLVNNTLRFTLKPLWRKGPSIATLRAKAAIIDKWVGRWFGRPAVEAVEANGVASEWIGDARTAERGVLLYLHGGAFCIHMPNAYRRLASRLARKTGMRVLLPDYRLAPEHPLPAGLQDCVAAYRWLLAQGFPASRIAIAGDSAGGNLTLATLMRARDEGCPMPARAALLSPVTDLGGSGPSVHDNERSDVMFSGPALAMVQKIYLGGQSPDLPAASPLFGDWQGLPPLLFHASTTEMLRDDSRRAVERARAAGVEARLKEWPDLPHVFQMLALLPEARRAVDEIGAFLGQRS
jgi:epsilon-lactone hydrolase